MKYFAYGSNMAFARLRARVPSAIILETCMLARHDLRFHKTGRDDSGKCDAYFTGQDSDRIWGILYEMDEAHLPGLREIEGHCCGYEEKSVEIVDCNGRRYEAMTYYADNDLINSNIKPYDWYKNHVLIGARAGNFPDDYIARIEVVACIVDSNSQRAEQEYSLHL